MTEQAIFDRIKKEIETNPVTLFMKGTAEQPMCGFSAQVVHILKSYGVTFHTINVLEDHEIREGIKEFTNWPTIPQLYVRGKFVGGCDITMELHRKGELARVLNAQ
jgi:monothiol glutaredoxin